MTRRRLFAVAGATVALLAGGTGLAIAYHARPEPVESRIPDRLADTTFWRLFATLSEPNGTFHSDNFVSNEAQLQTVIPVVRKQWRPHAAYLGVGPDQNFTYIVALHPSIAFIVDIRRQNALELLMYKALIETSADRAEFLSRLFYRPRPRGLDTNSTVTQLMEAFEGVRADGDLHDATMLTITTQLKSAHHFDLGDDDIGTIEYVLGAFFQDGPELTYTNTAVRSGAVLRFPGAYGGRPYGRMGMPSFADLAQQTDGDGVERGYLANEANFRALKDLEQRNLIVPVVGDFGGPRALRAVGRYLAANNSVVGAFYLSNVEQYLFMPGGPWRQFYANVSTLPFDDHSVFIRSVPGRWGRQRGRLRIQQMTSSLTDLLAAVRAGRIQTYDDVIEVSR